MNVYIWFLALLATLLFVSSIGAQAQSSSAIGQVETLVGNAFVVRADGKSDNLRIATPIFNGDTVQTGPSSDLGISFLDGTVFSLSANASMVINDLVYRSTGNANNMSADLVKGTFVFLAGKIASSGNMRIETPVAHIGIRGTQPWVVVTPAVTSFMITTERNGKSGEYFLHRKGADTILATVNRANIGSTRKIIMRSANDTPQIVDKTPQELQLESQLTRRLFATLQTRDARLGSGKNNKSQNRPQPNNRSHNNIRQSTQGQDQHASRLMPYGSPLFKSRVYFEIGGGLNQPDGKRTFDDFDQSIKGNLGAIGRGEIGVQWDNVFGAMNVSAGLVGQFQNWNHSKLVNDGQGGPSLPFNGTTQAFSLFPQVTVSGPLSDYVSWRAGAGAGVAFQKLKASDDAGGSVRGTKSTVMANINGGVGYMLMPGVDLWLNGFATWFGGFDVATNTNVASRYSPHWNAGAMVSMRFSLQPASPR